MLGPRIKAPSRPRRGIDSPVAFRRGEGSQMKQCRDPRCSPRGNPACRAKLGQSLANRDRLAPYFCLSCTSASFSTFFFFLQPFYLHHTPLGCLSLPFSGYFFPASLLPGASRAASFHVSMEVWGSTLRHALAPQPLSALSSPPHRSGLLPMLCLSACA